MKNSETKPGSIRMKQLGERKNNNSCTNIGDGIIKDTLTTSHISKSNPNLHLNKNNNRSKLLNEIISLQNRSKNPQFNQT